MTCQCGSIGADPTIVRFNACHHTYFRGDKQLPSVTQVLRCWPHDPCGYCHWPIYSDHAPGCPVKAKIDNARERGSELDALFSAYVNGTLNFIPPGTRKDVIALFDKLQTWWDRQGITTARCQVIVADDENAGTCDIVTEDMILDLKATYDINPEYPVQLGMYALLHNVEIARLGIIHVTERFKEPKFIWINHVDAIADAMTVRDMYRAVQRRTK